MSPGSGYLRPDLRRQSCILCERHPLPFLRLREMQEWVGDGTAVLVSRKEEGAAESWGEEQPEPAPLPPVVLRPERYPSLALAGDLLRGIHRDRGRKLLVAPRLGIIPVGEPGTPVGCGFINH